MFIKEFVQLRRDRLTFAHHDLHSRRAAPAVRLRHQHHAAPPADRRAGARGQRPRRAPSWRRSATPPTSRSPTWRAPKPRWTIWMRSGDVLFGVEIPAGFERSVRRGDRPALLVAADASDPVAAGTALGALEGIVSTALARDRGLPETSAVRLPPSRSASTAATIPPPSRASTSCRACSAPSSP